MNIFSGGSTRPAVRAILGKCGAQCMKGDIYVKSYSSVNPTNVLSGRLGSHLSGSTVGLPAGGAHCMPSDYSPGWSVSARLNLLLLIGLHERKQLIHRFRCLEEHVIDQTWTIVCNPNFHRSFRLRILHLCWDARTQDPA